MTTQIAPAPLVPLEAPRTRSEAVRDEVKAEAGRRDVSQRRLGALLGMSQQAVSDRWRGRTPWTVDELERLEQLFGLPALEFERRAIAARGSQPIGR